MRIKYLLCSILTLLIIACKTKKSDTDKISVLAYYVPQEGISPSDLPLKQLSHIIFSFTNVIDGEMKFQNPSHSGEILKQLVGQREKYPNLKVMVACGGWGADGFSDMALTEESRLKFVKSAIRFIKKYDLDGLDMDWEYPGISGAGTKARNEDKQNFTFLMKSLREHLDKLERKQTLSFASAGWKRYYDYVELTEVMKYVDYMNVMTYDQIGHTAPFTGHHTALGNIKLMDLEGTPAMDYVKLRNKKMAQSGRKFEPRSVESIVDFCINQGVNPKQIIIGAAFYGRAWKGVNPEQNGLYQPNNGSYIGWCAYQDIRERYENKNGFKRYWDPVAKAPYLFNPVDSIFFSYDDTASVKLKTHYAIDNKLGGIMFWELSNDTKEKDSLLDAIYSISNSKN